jgi:hypothetical protein
MTTLGDSNMAVNARIWIVPDAADLARTVQKAGANVGDFLFEFDNSTLWVIHTTGIVAISGSKIQPNRAALTDSTGGTVSQTLAAITAGAAYAQADAVATKNALASLAAEVNALRTSLVNSGQMTGP